eukprot:403342647
MVTLGISKDWNPILVNQSSVKHDDRNNSMPYQEEHSRQNTMRKLKQNEMRDILQNSNSVNGQNSKRDYSQQITSRNYRNSSIENSTSQTITQKQSLSPLKKISTKLLVNANKQKYLESQQKLLNQSNLALNQNQESVYSSDLKNYVSNFNIKDQFHDKNGNSDIKIPQLAIQVYNVLTDKINQYQPPDLPIYEDQKYQKNYQRLLNHEKSFNKKVGYFTYEVKNKQELQRHLRNDQSYIDKEERTSLHHSNIESSPSKGIPSKQKRSSLLLQKITSNQIANSRIRLRSKYTTTSNNTMNQGTVTNNKQSSIQLLNKESRATINTNLQYHDYQNTSLEMLPSLKQSHFSRNQSVIKQDQNTTSKYGVKTALLYGSQSELRSDLDTSAISYNNQNFQSINEKSIMNLIGGDKQMDQLKNYFKRKQQKSVQPNIREKYRLEYLNSKQIQYLEQIQDFTETKEATRYQHMSELEQIKEFDEKHCQSISSISNLPRIKSKYQMGQSQNRM